MSGTKKNKTSTAALAEHLAEGTQKHLSTVPILVDGETLTATQVVTQLTTLATLRNAVDAAKVVVKGKIAEEKSKGPALEAFLLAFKGFVLTAFGTKPEILADFGLAPKKVRQPLTVEQKAAAKAKREATREVRGTGSKKKKLAVKGNVTGVVVTPVTQPAPTSAGTPAAPNAGSPAAPSAAPNGATSAAPNGATH
jgi:hypothetical protein